MRSSGSHPRWYIRLRRKHRQAPAESRAYCLRTRAAPRDIPCGSGERCESRRSQEHGPARVPGLGPGTREAAGTQNAWRPLPASRPYHHDHRRIPGVRAVTASERRRTRPNHQQRHRRAGGSTRFGATSRILRTAPNPARGEKVGRNKPCPCESGKKFKYCHGRAGEKRYYGPQGAYVSTTWTRRGS